MKIETDSTTIMRQHLTIRRSDLLELLAEAGLKIPTFADITIRVPGGGDWSNMDLDLDDTVINVDWTE